MREAVQLGFDCSPKLSTMDSGLHIMPRPRIDNVLSVSCLPTASPETSFDWKIPPKPSPSSPQFPVSGTRQPPRHEK